MSNFSEQTLQPWQVDLPTYADPQSQALIQRCLAGEESAYVALYNGYAGMIYRLCISLLQHREDAEEVLQDSFEYAFRRLDQYDASKSAFKTWLYRIAVSRCHNKRRRKWLPTFSLSQLIQQGQDVTDSDTPTPAETMQLTEKQQVVWAAIQNLSGKLRETAVLRYYEGFTFVEIGHILGIPTKTAESRMRLAHNALRKALAEQIER
ncbi:RNA polymerase sigma factor [Candidatus Leptofilum sp.]|uniref:RNA polymerase sigma factor n=1 Tax=Candidatus Leptofilum sp. TaxID=3241576 RepID=UPI003B59EB99